MNEAEIRIKSRISNGELERRWKAVRQAMTEQSLDFLIMQSSTDVLGGYVKWFTDLAVLNNYTATVIFARDEDMTTIFHGPYLPARPMPPEWAVRGVKKRISVPAIPSLDFSKYYMAEKVVEELRQYKNCHIGLVGTGFLSAAFYNYVTKHLTTAEFKDATDLVDNIKAIKSDEEIGCIKEVCALQDAAFEYLLKRIHPGMTERDVYNDVIYKCMELGTSQVNIMGGSAQPGKPVMLMQANFANKVIEEGDQFSILIEVNGPSGFWAEFIRTICLGKVTTELEEQFELCRQLQKVTLDLLKPGADPGPIWDANNAFLRNKGYPDEMRVYAHGMGYDMVERPAISHDESMKIKPCMCLAVHPTVMSAKASGMICENYIVSDKGEIICLHETPQKIFKL
jgi:Xaa-Pro aminopeptidase